MRRVLLLTAWTAVGIGLCMVSVSVAADKKKNENKPGAAATAQVDDKTFAQKAGADNLAEINLSQLAARKAGTAEVRQLAEHIAKDHFKANEQLNRILGKEGIPAATEMNQAHAALWKKLAGMSGSAFDHEYLEATLKDHKQAIQLFQGEAKNGKNAALKQYAQQTLPELENHLKMTQDAFNKVKGSGTTTGKKAVNQPSPK